MAITLRQARALWKRQNGCCFLTGGKLKGIHFLKKDSKAGNSLANLCMVMEAYAGFEDVTSVLRLSKEVKAHSSSSKQGLLYGSRVYLGGNIENCKNPISWREEIAESLSQLGVVSLSPTQDAFLGHPREDKEMGLRLRKLRGNGRYGKVADIMRMIVQKDLRMIDISDFTIFKLDVEKPTWGTPHEIIQAALQRKPVLFLVEDRRTTPLWFLRYVPPKHIFETVGALIKYLTKIHKGIVPLDTKLWKLLQPNLRYVD